MNVKSALIGLVLSFVLTVVVMKFFIPMLIKLSVKQTEREEGLESHKAKSGTPTMGGVVFIVCSIVVAYVLNFKSLNSYVHLMTFAFLGYGLVGFIDDFLIVVKHNNDGLKPSVKFLLLSLVTIVFMIVASFTLPNYSTTIRIPVTHFELNLHALYPVLVFIMFTAESNAVNLTDGLDGLASGQCIIALAPFTLFALMQKEPQVVVYCAVIIGALLGFLVYNAHPAKIFMGDTGSLALGGVLAALAVITKQELLLIIIGGVFLIETLSVIIQVASFKLTGKRVFKMAPIHHHFEMMGWSETQVVISFWFVGFVLGVIGILLGVI